MKEMPQKITSNKTFLKKETVWVKYRGRKVQEVVKELVQFVCIARNL
jgi:hypothetical protein